MKPAREIVFSLHFVFGFFFLEGCNLSSVLYLYVVSEPNVELSPNIKMDILFLIVES